MCPVEDNPPNVPPVAAVGSEREDRGGGAKSGTREAEESRPLMEGGGRRSSSADRPVKDTASASKGSASLEDEWEEDGFRRDGIVNQPTRK